MAAELRWDDAEDLGIALADKYPDLNPLEVRFTDLHRYVTELPTFVDDARCRTSRSSKPSRWPGTRNTRTETSRPQTDGNLSYTSSGCGATIFASRRNFAASSGGVGF